MDNVKIGQFISELRKSNQMTQKDLATKLDVTDKAVSKWERGLSCPDISLLSPLAEILGITTGELLNGEKCSTDSADVEINIDNALQYADKAIRSKAKTVQRICAIAFSLLVLIGIAVCAICDMAIAGAFTWSLYPISSLVFAWLVCFPVMKFGKKGITGSMIALSVLIIPFLYVLDYLIKISDLMMPIGVRMSFISIAYLWVIYGIFKILRERKILALAISVLCAVPVSILIDLVLLKIISAKFIDIWNILGYSIIAAVSIILWIIDYSLNKKKC